MSVLCLPLRETFLVVCVLRCVFRRISKPCVIKLAQLDDTRLADSTKCCRKSFLTSYEAHNLWEEVVQCSVCRECWGRMGNAHPALLRRRSCPRVPAREASERCQKVFLPASRPEICPASKSGTHAGELNISPFPPQ